LPKTIRPIRIWTLADQPNNLIMKKHARSAGISRRQFAKTSLAAAGILGFPTVLPSHLFGKDAPSKKIQVAHIGCGRIAHEMDMPGIIKHDIARYVAVCDVDSKRMEHAKKFMQDYYAKKKDSDTAVAVKTFSDFRELIKDPSIDAVAISTPDHWHSEPV